MDIYYFFEKFKEKVSYLIKEKIYYNDLSEKSCYYNDKGGDDLGYYAWTALINTAVYLIVHEYNNNKKD